MRYSYLEIFVEHSAAEADLRYDAGHYYKDNFYHWYDAEEGISFYFDEAYATIRVGHIRIPEAHPLFAYGIMLEMQFARVMPFPRVPYLKSEEYARKLLANAGIPMTVSEATKYDDQ